MWEMKAIAGNAITMQNDRWQRDSVMATVGKIQESVITRIVNKREILN